VLKYRNEEWHERKIEPETRATACKWQYFKFQESKMSQEKASESLFISVSLEKVEREEFKYLIHNSHELLGGRGGPLMTWAQGSEFTLQTSPFPPDYPFPVSMQGIWKLFGERKNARAVGLLRWYRSKKKRKKANSILDGRGNVCLWIWLWLREPWPIVMHRILNIRK